MPTQFVLELRQVSSLTQARFAAGEGFTHIRLGPSILAGQEKEILEIKSFLSGVAVGLDSLEDGEMPHWADYFVQDGLVTHLRLVYPFSVLPEPFQIFEQADLQSPLPEMAEYGISLPGLYEEKLGHASYDAHQDFLDQLSGKFNLL
jgi:hypothetical protein